MFQFFVALEIDAAELGGALHERHEQIRVVVGDFALEDGGDALEAHAGIHARLRERAEFSFGIAVKLHEHQIPNLNVAPAVTAKITVFVTFVRCDWPHVVMDFAAWTARTGVAHGPKIVLRPKFVNSMFLYPYVHPLLVSFCVAGYFVFATENRYVYPVFRNREPFRRRDQLPCKGDGFLLEIVAEGKIAQHLEESVVAFGEPDVFEVVVLAAGADAFLATGGALVVALLQAEEDVLELIHAGVGEEQRGVANRDERRAAHDPVIFLLEEVQKR